MALSIDNSGNATAVWSHFDGSRFNAAIFASQLVAGQGWQAPGAIEQNDTPKRFRPSLAVDYGSGPAWVTENEIDRFVNVCISGVPWDEGVSLPNNTTTYQELAVEAFPGVAGTAVKGSHAVWLQCRGVTPQIWASHQTAEQRWREPVLIASGGKTDFVQPPSLADGMAGERVAVWEKCEFDGGRSELWAIRSNGEQGWGPAELIATSKAAPRAAGQAVVVIEGTGVALAVWQQWNQKADRFENYSSWAKRDGQWSPPALVDPEISGDSSLPVLVEGPGHSVLAVWTQKDRQGKRPRASRFLQAGGWAKAHSLETPTLRDVQGVGIAALNTTTALVLYSTAGDNLPDYRVAGFQLWTSKFSPDTGWTNPARVYTQPDASGARWNMPPTWLASVPVQDGEAAFVFSAYHGESFSLQSIAIDVDTGLGKVTMVSDPNRSVSGIGFARHSSGMAAALWTYSEANTSMWSSFYR